MDAAIRRDVPDAVNEVPAWVRWAGASSVALVALVAAVVSYSHMHTVAERAGEGWRAWLDPLSVDGLLVGTSLVIYARRRAGWLAWTGMATGILISLAANLAAARPDLVARLVAAWPAVALALSYEVLLTLVRQAGAEASQAVNQEEHGEAPAAESVGGSAGDDLAPDLVTRAAELVSIGEAEGVKVGRGTLARQLGISDYQARQVLRQVAERRRPDLRAVGAT